MPFLKYEVPAPAKSDVRLSANGIAITQTALDAHGLGSAEYVNLYWDAELHLIGLSPSTKEDKSAFKIATRGRGQGSKFVAASKFFDKFGIPAEASSAASGLKEIDGIAAFDVNLPSVNEVKKPYTGKPRGRRPKDAQADAA